MAPHNPPTALAIELVPGPNWKWNLRSELTSSQWDKLRKKVYEKAGYVCEVCGVAPEKSLEAHEKWEYTDGNPGTQTLIGIEALCKKCHMVRHAGLWFSKGMGHVILTQLMKVNRIPLERAEEMVNEAFSVWKVRSSRQWNPPDMTWLKSLKTT